MWKNIDNHFNQKSAERANNEILIYYYNYFPRKVYKSRPIFLIYSIRYIINGYLQFFLLRRLMLILTINLRG